MSDDFDKKAYEPMNIGIAIFIAGLLAAWLFNTLGLEKIAQICNIIAILAFLVALGSLQSLMYKSINDKFKKDDNNKED